MASKNSDLRMGAGRSPAGGQVRRPTATIDVKATVVETHDVDAAVEGARSAAAAAADAARPQPSETAKAAAGSSQRIAAESAASAAAKVEAAAAKPKSAATATEPPRARARGGFLSHLAASIVGGLIALFGVNYLANQTGIDTRLLDPQKALLADRLQAVEVKLAEQRAAPAADAAADEVGNKLATLEAKLASLAAGSGDIDALKEQQAKLTERLAAAEKSLGTLAAATPAARDDDLAQRLAVLEGTIDDLAQAANAGGGKVPQLALLTGKINDIEQQIDGKLAGVRKGVAEELQKQIAAFDARFVQQRSADAVTAEAIATVKVGTKRLDVEIETVRTEAERLAQKIETLRVAGDSHLQSLDGIRSDIAKLDGAIVGTRSDLDAKMAVFAKADQVAAAVAPLSQQMSEVKQNLEAVMQGDNQRKESTSRVLLSLEIANLKRAIERGGSYEKELAQVKALAPADLKMASLEANAAAGLPNDETLTQSFQQVIRDAIDAENRASTEQGGILDQLLTGAKSIVRVRQTGHVEGEGAEAVIARMEEALMDGRLSDIATEAKSLSGPAAAAAEPWLKKLAARVEVEHALAEIEDSVKRLIGAAPSN